MIWRALLIGSFVCLAAWPAYARGPIFKHSESSKIDAKSMTPSSLFVTAGTNDTGIMSNALTPIGSTANPVASGDGVAGESTILEPTIAPQAITSEEKDKSDLFTDKQRTQAATQREFENVYQELAFPKISTGVAQNLTVTQLNVSTITLTGSINITSLNLTTGTVQSFMVVGTATNNDAPIGRLGEFVSSIVTVAVNAATSGNYDDLTSISLTAGDWDVSAIESWSSNTSSWSQLRAGISTASGNDATGLNTPDNQVLGFWANSATTPLVVPFTIPVFRVSLSGTSTYYLKRLAVYTGGPPQATGRLSARRVR